MSPLTQGLNYRSACDYSLSGLESKEGIGLGFEEKIWSFSG